MSISGSQPSPTGRPLGTFALLISLLAVVGLLSTAGLVVPARAEAAVLGDRLYSNQTARASDQLVAGGGAFRFAVQRDGNAVVYSRSGAPTWNTRTSVPGSRLVLQGDGNAVIYTPTNRPVWSSGTAGRPADRLQMQNDGNLVIYGRDGRPTWSSRTGVIAPPPPPGPRIVGTTLTAGARLNAGTALLSGAYKTVMQGDGNLVLYANGRAQWHTRTSGNPGAYLVMQTDGNAVVYSAARRPIWSSGTVENPGSRLALQRDGNLVIYKADNRPSWSRLTGRIPGPSDKGWELRSFTVTNSYGDFDGTARITNRNPRATTGGFTLTLFSGGRQVGILEGSASSVGPGQTVTVGLYSFDSFVAGPWRVEFQTDFSYEPYR